MQPHGLAATVTVTGRGPVEGGTCSASEIATEDVKRPCIHDLIDGGSWRQLGAGPPSTRRALQLRVRAFPPALVKGWKYGMQVTEGRAQNVGGTVGPRSSVVAGLSPESQARFSDDERAGRWPGVN